MASEGESEVTRRELLKLGGGVAAAVGTGGSIPYITDGEYFPSAGRNHIADLLHLTGRRRLEVESGGNFSLKFAESAKSIREGTQVILTARSLTSGEAIGTSYVEIDWNNDRDSKHVDSITGFDGFLSDIEASINLSQRISTGLYQRRSGGVLCNLVEGVKTPENPATVTATLSADMGTIVQEADDVVVTVHEVTPRGLSLVDQTRILQKQGQFEVGNDQVASPSADVTPSERFHRTRNNGRDVIWYRWRTRRKTYEIVFPVHTLSYTNAINKETRFVTGTFETAKENPYGRLLGEGMMKIAEASDSSSQVEALAFNLVRTFCQTWPYRLDTVAKDQLDYANYVEETLVEGCGDCEDKAVLMASILEQPPFGYDTALIFPPDHAALGVAASDLPDGVAIDPEDALHSAVEIDGEPYIYVESTAVREVGKAEYPVKDTRAVYDGQWRSVDFLDTSGGIVNYIKKIFR